MNKYLLKNYSLLGKETKKENKVSKGIKAVVKNNNLHFILFGVIMFIVANLAVNKVYPDIIPYTFQTAFAITLCYGIAAIGFCLLMGYSGLASLGTGGFLGIGAYAMHYIVREAELSFGLAIIVALGIALLVGVIVGIISLRIEGIYLVILTLVLSEIFRNFYSEFLDDNAKIKNFEIFDYTVKKQDSLYIAAIAIVIVMIVTNNIIKSPTGRAMLAMKNSTAAAQAMGISLIKYRLLAFIICTMYAALAGAILLIPMRTIKASNDAGTYALITSLNILAAVIIGGYKSIWGAIFGAFVMYGMRSTVLQNIDFFVENPEFLDIVTGVLVILVVMFFPGGLAQLLLEAKTKIKTLIKKIKEGIYGKDLG